MKSFDSTKVSLAAILNDIVSGKIQLPDFQRGWVWDDEHILSLLVSIARSFPIGSVMLLQAGGDVRFKVRPIEGLDSALLTPEKTEQMILDGQQRLTSLTQVLKLKDAVTTRDAKKRKLKRHYYINIEKALEGADSFEEAFFGVDENRQIRSNFARDVDLDLSSPHKEFEAFCFPCDQILNSDRWEEGLNEFDKTRFSRYMEFRKNVLNAFREYDVPLIVLSKDVRKEAVCLVFEKVNTGGVPLSVFELLTATFAADSINLRDEWYGNPVLKTTGISQTLKKQRLLSNVEPTEFFQSLTLLHTWQKRQDDLAQGKVGKQATGVSAKREAVLSLPLAAYTEWKDRLAKAYVNVAKFLRKESFYSERDLPYATQLVPLAAILTILGDSWLETRIYNKIAKWYWCGVFGELYGGAVEGRMALDLQDFIEWEKDDNHIPVTVRDASFQSGRLETMKSRLSAAYKGIYVLLQREGAMDFFWKTKIRDLEDSDWDEYSLDIHHIFPKKWCEDNSISPAVYNAIINKTPISYKANRMINHKSIPSDYLAYLQTHKNVMLDDADMDAILRTHLIDPQILRSNDFKAFMETRKQALLTKIEAVMGKAVENVASSITSDED